MLDVQPLHYSFDNPVDVGQFFQVVFDVTYGHQPGSALAVECSRSCFESPLQAHPRHLVAIFASIWRYNIEQQTGDANVSEMSSNGRSHHAGAQYRCLANLIRHDYEILSIIVEIGR